MSTDIKKSYIVFLKDIHLKNVIDQIDNIELHANEETEITSYEQQYDNIPKEFVSVNTWIKRTNLKCWSCSNNFDNPPVFIPTSISDKCVGVHGNFCSWNCAASYIDANYKKSQQWHYTKMLSVLYKKFTGQDVTTIVLSPPKTIMKQYCGDSGVSVNDYKAIIANIVNEYHNIGL